MKGIIGGISVILLAFAAHAMAFEHKDNNIQPRPGATVMGGPSGNDGDGGLISPSLTSIETNSQVNEWNEDDHSIHLKHTKVDPRPVMVPVAFGSSGSNGPRGSGQSPIEKRGVHSVTVMGGPSGDDSGESSNAPNDVKTATGIFEHNEGDHSIELSHEDVYHPPPFRASAPVRPSEDQEGPSSAGPPVKHFAPSPANHLAPHAEPHFEHNLENHPEPHNELHPEPHFVNHPEPHYDSHYSPSYEPHYEPHTSLENDFEIIKNTNNGPAAGAISFGRR